MSEDTHKVGGARSMIQQAAVGHILFEGAWLRDTYYAPQLVPVRGVVMQHLVVGILNVLSQEAELWVLHLKHFEFSDARSSQTILKRVQALLSLI